MEFTFYTTHSSAMTAKVLLLPLAFCATTLLAQDLPTIASRNDAEAQQRAGQASSSSSTVTPTYRGKTGRAAEKAYQRDKASQKRHEEDNIIYGTDLPGGVHITPDGTWLNPDGTVRLKSKETPKEREKRLKRTEKLKKKHAKQDRKDGYTPN